MQGNEEKQMPLSNMSINVDIQDSISTIKITQTYINQLKVGKDEEEEKNGEERKPIEC